MSKKYFVYILTNKSLTFYIGITSNLSRRIQQHKEKVADSFSARYNISKLVYVEIFENPNLAISREKQIKKYSRRKKFELIHEINPKFDEIVDVL